jgi:hypothetical protein
MIYGLAMAEMTALVEVIYRKYNTIAHKGFNNASPGITSRYEVFYDSSYLVMLVCLSAFT